MYPVESRARPARLRGAAAVVGQDAPSRLSQPRGYTLAGGIPGTEPCLTRSLIHGRERALGWEPHGDGGRVETDRGAYEAERLVVAARAWAGTLVPELHALAEPERQVLAWLQPSEPELFAPERFPVFKLQVDDGRYYGLPVFSVPGFKFGRYHHFEETGSANAIERECHPRDEALLPRHQPVQAATLHSRAGPLTEAPREEGSRSRRLAWAGSTAERSASRGSGARG
jgi:glycine/D-amino acid oxidase-like deaminating enzyme